MTLPRLPKDVPSLERPGHVHLAGTPVVVVEVLPTSVLCEVRTHDAALEGEGWYETLEVQEPLRVGSSEDDYCCVACGEKVGFGHAYLISFIDGRPSRCSKCPP